MENLFAYDLMTLIVAGICFLLTEGWKKLIPAAAAASPLVSMGLGVLGAIIFGLGEGHTIATIMQGIMSGGTASVSYDLKKMVLIVVTWAQNTFKPKGG